MRDVTGELRRVANTSSPELLLGETGIGKQVAGWCTRLAQQPSGSRRSGDHQPCPLLASGRGDHVECGEHGGVKREKPGRGRDIPRG